MSTKKTKHSTCKVVKTCKNGLKVVIGYLSQKDENNGLDIRLDMQGYKIIAL